MSQGVEYVAVKNFEKFQHYKNRNPPWIKLYNDLLDDYAFGCLHDASKWLAVGIWLLASRYDNRIPNDPRWIGQRINATEKVNLEPLLRCGFIRIISDDSNTLAPCKQSALLEREREGEKEIASAAASTTTEEGREYPPEPVPQASGGEHLSFKEISSLYLNTFPVVSVVPMVQQTLQQWRKDYPRGIIEEAFTRAARANARTLGYVEKLLTEGLREDITADEDYVPFTEKYANGGK